LSKSGASYDFSNLDKDIAFKREELRVLYARLEEEKKEKTTLEDIKQVEIINPTWFKFENYLFDIKVWQHLSFCINCNIIWDELLCSCINISNVNNIFMEYILEKIRKLKIPSDIIDYSQSFKDIDLLLTYFDDYPPSDCINSLKVNIKEYFNSDVLDSFNCVKLEVLDIVQKFWFYLNYKISTRVSNINVPIYTKSNTWDKIPLEIDNELSELGLESIVKSLINNSKQIVDNNYENIELMIELIEKTYELVVVDKFSNFYTWVIISNIIRFPLYFREEYTNKINFKLCHLYKKWFKLCSISKKVYIYKYSYLLAINNIVNKIELNINTSNKNGLLREFYNDINKSAISEQQYYEDIELIKDNILKTEKILWYTSSNEYTCITRYILTLINGDLSIVFSNINEYQKNNILKSENCNDISLLTAPIIRTSVDKEPDNIIINSWKLKYDDNLINCLFPNLIEYTAESYKLNIFLALFQIVHSCKIEKTNDSLYPFIIPQFNYENNSSLIINSDNISSIENILHYKIDKLEKLKEDNNYPCENVNTSFNLISDKLYFNYLNNYISFVQSKNSNYLKHDGNFLPFVKYGYDIIDEYVPVPIQYGESLEKINNNSLYTKNKLINNLTVGSGAEFNTIFEEIEKDDIILDPLEYNIYIFTHLFLNMDNGIDSIKEGLLYSIENIKLDNISHINKLICISNCIKYYLKKNNKSKVYDYINYLNNIIIKKRIITNNINISCSNEIKNIIMEKKMI
jgi:hypothetical protein